MIWDAAPHNAFTDLIRWKNRWYCASREGTAHSSFDGTASSVRWMRRPGKVPLIFGHSTLIARRLVERGVRFANVTWDLFWDRVQLDYDAWTFLFAKQGVSAVDLNIESPPSGGGECL